MTGDVSVTLTFSPRVWRKLAAVAAAMGVTPQGVLERLVHRVAIGDVDRVPQDQPCSSECAGPDFWWLRSYDAVTREYRCHVCRRQWK